MSRQFIDYTNKKLLMARSSWYAARGADGVEHESLRQGFLFHCCGAVHGLLAEVLESCLIAPGQPVSFVQAEKLLTEKKVLSGSFQHLKGLAENGWLNDVLQEFQKTQQVSIDNSFPAALNCSQVIATSVTCSGKEESYLQSLQQLIQDIRGQLQEW